MNFCILIPVFNGAQTIRHIIRGIKAFTSDIIIVNDGSTDDTKLIAQKQGVTILEHPENRGKGASLRTGFEYILKNTTFEYIMVMDADGQHSPKFIKDFLKVAEESKADLIIGNRMQDISNMPLIRRWTNKTMSFIISSLTRQSIPDTQCGYRLLKRRLLENIKLETSNYDTESEILLKATKKHFKIASVRISTIYRGEKSNINPAVDTFRFIRLLIRLWVSLR